MKDKTPNNYKLVRHECNVKPIFQKTKPKIEQMKPSNHGSTVSISVNLITKKKIVNNKKDKKYKVIHQYGSTQFNKLSHNLDQTN